MILLGCVSVARLSVAYQERLDRHGEIAAVVAVETAKMESLQSGFDSLFTVGGEQRLLENQDQWIAPQPATGGLALRFIKPMGGY